MSIYTKEIVTFDEWHFECGETRMVLTVQNDRYVTAWVLGFAHQHAVLLDTGAGWNWVYGAEDLPDAVRVALPPFLEQHGMPGRKRFAVLVYNRVRHQAAMRNGVRPTALGFYNGNASPTRTPAASFSWHSREQAASVAEEVAHSDLTIATRVVGLSAVGKLDMWNAEDEQ